jgi:hypothetical protein
MILNLTDKLFEAFESPEYSKADCKKLFTAFEDAGAGGRDEAAKVGIALREHSEEKARIAAEVFVDHLDVKAIAESYGPSPAVLLLIFQWEGRSFSENAMLEFTARMVTYALQSLPEPDPQALKDYIGWIDFDDEEAGKRFSDKLIKGDLQNFLTHCSEVFLLDKIYSMVVPYFNGNIEEEILFILKNSDQGCVHNAAARSIAKRKGLEEPEPGNTGGTEIPLLELAVKTVGVDFAKKAYMETMKYASLTIWNRWEIIYVMELFGCDEAVELRDGKKLQFAMRSGSLVVKYNGKKAFRKLCSSDEKASSELQKWIKAVSEKTGLEPAPLKFPELEDDDFILAAMDYSKCRFQIILAVKKGKDLSKIIPEIVFRNVPDCAVLQALIDAGLDVNKPNKFGWYLLDKVMENMSNGAILELWQVKTLDMLVDLRAAYTIDMEKYTAEQGNSFMNYYRRKESEQQ